MALHFVKQHAYFDYIDTMDYVLYHLKYVNT